MSVHRLSRHTRPHAVLREFVATVLVKTAVIGAAVIAVLRLRGVL